MEGRVPLKHREEGDEREVPIFPVLRPILEGQRASLGPEPSGLFLPGTGRWGDRIGADEPFSPEAYLTRVRATWEAVEDEEGEPAPLDPLGLHEARHSFASWLVLAGYDVATISAWLGHRQVSTTLDRYVKPMRRRGVKPADVHAYLGELCLVRRRPRAGRITLGGSGGGGGGRVARRPV